MADYERSSSQSQRLLAIHGVLQPPVDVTEIAKSEGLDVLFEELEDKISGFLLKAPSGAVIGVNSRHHRNRQRFTIAHELGHHCMHPDEPTVYVDDVMVHFRGEDIHAPLTQTEIEANAFAASLLMPEEFLKSDLAGRQIDVLDETAVRHLAHRYQVSVQALTIRLVELRMVRGMYGESLFT